VIDPLPIGTGATPRLLSWPEFDRWQAVFAAAEIFPPGWESLRRVPAPETREAEEYHLRRLVLFCEWTDMIAGRPAVRAHYARQKIRVRVERQDKRAPCPVCQPLDSREIGLEIDTMPPFHPGCRCVLVALHRRPERPRSRLG
jgi:hypothetical protein